MEPGESPWIGVPEDWLDDKYSRHDGYRAFQEYFDLKIKPDVVNEYLIGKGILSTTKIEVARSLRTIYQVNLELTLHLELLAIKELVDTEPIRSKFTGLSTRYTSIAVLTSWVQAQ